MESLFLTVKFWLFLAMEIFVVATVGVTLIAGLYQMVRDKVRQRMEAPVGRSHLPTRVG
jgi:hypothetical protein